MAAESKSRGEAKLREGFKEADKSQTEHYVSDWMSTGWVDSLEMQELGGDSFWVHNTSLWEKPQEKCLTKIVLQVRVHV